MISGAQIRLVRTAVSRLGLSEEDYRSLLAQVGAKTAKDLDQDTIQVVMKSLEKLGWKSTDRRPRGNDSGSGSHATTAQLRMIQALWKERARVKTDDALNAFAKRITGRHKLEWLTVHDIRKLKKAIEELK